MQSLVQDFPIRNSKNAYFHSKFILKQTLVKRLKIKHTEKNCSLDVARQVGHVIEKIYKFIQIYTITHCIQICIAIFLNLVTAQQYYANK